MAEKGEESLEERQENEVEALKAIYDTDFEDLRNKDVWKVRRPPEFLLKMKPDHDSRGPQQEMCTVDLHVKCGDKYPMSIPELDLVSAKGVSQDLIDKLKLELKSIAAQMVGEVMIMDIAQHVSSWLQVQQRQKISYSSFYEEMQARHKRDNEQQEEKKRQELEINQQISKEERARLLEEVAKTQEALREMRRQPRQVSVSSEAPNVPVKPKMRKNSSASISVSESSFKSANHEWDGVKTLFFSMKGEKIRVERLNLIGNNVHGGSVYAGYLPENGGKLVAISEWHYGTAVEKKSKKVAFTDSYSRDEKTFLKQLGTIEQELSGMVLRSAHHPNVVQYLGLSYESHTLRVFQEFVHGSNFSFYLTENVPIDLATLRFYAQSILEALAFMHERNVVHRDLRDTSIFMESSGLIRVGDFSIDKRVRDLICDSINEAEKFPMAIGRGGKKVDIFRLGALVLSFSLGDIIQDPVVIPKGLSPEFADFLKKCFMKDERDRWTADQLLDHSWIKHRLEHLPSPNLENNQDIPDANKEDSKEDSGEASDEEKPLPVYWIGSSGQSRLQSEFSFICNLGKGGFGEVFKVKNNLDSQIYAIKRIKLDPKNKPLEKKLKREVELLSRLNHENVVRYYSSWFEEGPSNEMSQDNSETEEEEEVSKSMLSLVNNPVVTDDDDDDESSDDGDEVDIFGASFLPFNDHHQSWSDDGDSDSDIVFEHSSTTTEVVDESVDEGDACPKCDADPDADSIVVSKKAVKFMFIQMEFCDKQTLRSAIDNELFNDSNRVWRMFREIIEGLLHIHSQGMIHRDLKPVNIFLGRNDQVKIGDFGLATTSVKPDALMASSLNRSLSTDENMTGQIGTAMYVAPEINTGKVIAAYSQKVDIYSLGVIFFEMCHPPLMTGMERIKILSSLRSKEIVLPKDFETMHEQQSHIIKWLLNHDPSLRPTSLELLQSDYLPPPQVEEAELQEMTKHTLANHTSKSYRHLIDACLSQTVDIKRDIIYDMDLPGNLAAMKKFFMKQEHVRKIVLGVFHRHGALQIPIPQLVLKGKALEVYGKVDSAVKAMTRSGNVVFLPHDLRVPLARFLARSKLTSFKRYNLAPVFREKRMFGLQPKEIIECAFDIVGPTKNLIADAETILVVDEILRDLSSFKESGYFFRISHTGLLRGILNHFCINEQNHGFVHDAIRCNVESKKTRMANLAHLAHIPEQVVANLFNILEKEGSADQLASVLRPMIKRNNEAGHEIKRAIGELDSILNHCKAIGVKAKILVSPSLVYQPEHFSGMVCQVVVKKKRGGHDILAAGGRFDSLIYNYASALNIEDLKVSPPCGVGISISLDILASGIRDDELDSSFSTLDVLLHSTKSSKAKLELASQLWSRGIRCSICDPGWSVNDVDDLALESGANCIVIFQDSSDASNARLRSICSGGERFTERKIPLSELLETVAKQIENGESNQNASSSSGLMRMDSTSKMSGAEGPQVMFDFQYFPDKKNAAVKKRLEASISTKLTSVLTALAPTTFVQVLVLPFQGQVIRSLIAYMDFEEDKKFHECLKELISKHPRHKKELTSICEDINDLKTGKGLPNSLFVFYSSEDHSFKILML